MIRREFIKNLFVVSATWVMAPLAIAITTKTTEQFEKCEQWNKEQLKPWEIADDGMMSLFGQTEFPSYGPSGGLMSSILTYRYVGGGIVHVTEKGRLKTSIHEMKINTDPMGENHALTI